MTVPARAAETVVFLHAHPDDEAIFSGGTLLRLADAGVRTVVLFATNGDHDPHSDLARRRADEARAACHLLDVTDVGFLGFGDSGLYGESAEPDAFCLAEVAAVAESVARVVRRHAASALVTYDGGGIYGHPDHVMVHRVGAAVHAAGVVPTRYECTVDREYLHFVETHLVGHAVNSLLGIEVPATNLAPLGVPTVEVSTVVDVRGRCATKRAALAAHRSQIPPDSEALTMPPASFEGVYGFEWYVRFGPAGPLERIAY